MVLVLRQPAGWDFLPQLRESLLGQGQELPTVLVWQVLVLERLEFVPSEEVTAQVQAELEE